MGCGAGTPRPRPRPAGPPSRRACPGGRGGDAGRAPGPRRRSAPARCPGRGRGGTTPGPASPRGASRRRRRRGPATASADEGRTRPRPTNPASTPSAAAASAEGRATTGTKGSPNPTLQGVRNAVRSAAPATSAAWRSAAPPAAPPKARRTDGAPGRELPPDPRDPEGHPDGDPEEGRHHAQLPSRRLEEREPRQAEPQGGHEPPRGGEERRLRHPRHSPIRHGRPRASMRRCPPNAESTIEGRWSFKWPTRG